MLRAPNVENVASYATDKTTRQLGEKISVCLLTFNHEAVIVSTLQSILDQTITGYEVIVSDDCSTDGTWERIIEFAKRDARIKPLQTPHNVGMPGNANFAVAHSDRPYIALLHHDDIYRRDLLEKWADLLERYSDAGFVFNHYDSATPAHHDRSRFDGECFDGKWLLEKILLARWDSPIRGTAMIRRHLWDRVGGMREEFKLVADVDLWMRLSSVSNVGYVPERLIYVRVCRPDYYPDIYTGKSWHWNRLILVYEIHASNRLRCLPMKTIGGRLQWLLFRVRVTVETTKWLIYAIVKKRPEMITACGESETQYDLWPLRVLRRILLSWSRTNPAEGGA
jgi:glycosyltransferase involved in cell wall biosynthesis